MLEFPSNKNLNVIKGDYRVEKIKDMYKWPENLYKYADNEILIVFI